jgi:hypothetical protein
VSIHSSWDPVPADTAPTDSDDGLQLLTRRDAGQALQTAMTIPALAGPSPAGIAEPLKVTK